MICVHRFDVFTSAISEARGPGRLVRKILKDVRALMELLDARR